MNKLPRKARLIILALLIINGFLLAVYVGNQPPPEPMQCAAPGVLYVDGQGGWYCLQGGQHDI